MSRAAPKRKRRTRKIIIAEEQKRLAALRMQMLEHHPFWGYLLLQVKLVPAPELACIAATDCVRHIWYNPKFTQHLSTAQLGFVLAHEVGHQVFASGPRQRGRNHSLWNCATDYAINRMVASIGHPARPGEPLYAVPNGKIPGLGEMKILLDPKWKDMIAEAIYEYLAADDMPEPVSLTLVLGDAETGDAIEVPNLTDHGGGIDVHLPDGLSQDERDVLAERIGAAIGHWAHQQQTGDLPGRVARAFDAKQSGRVPWRRLLHRFAGQAIAKDDYSLARPNRRYLDHDIVVPGLYSDRVGHVVVAVDTSGSMTAEQLSDVGAELRHIAEQVGEMTLIVADAKVQEVVPFEGLESFLLRATMKGGGGTDHRPVFEWLAENRLRPDLFIGLTDLFTRLPTVRPHFPVLWVTPSKHGTAPWGTLVHLD